MWENGNDRDLMDTVFTFLTLILQSALNTKENGKTGLSMDLGLSNTEIQEMSTWGIFIMGSQMEKENMFGSQELSTKGTLKTVSNTE